MIKIHRKLGNFFIAENDVTIAMCTQSGTAKRIRNALQKEEAALSLGGPHTAASGVPTGPRSPASCRPQAGSQRPTTSLDARCPHCGSEDVVENRVEMKCKKCGGGYTK